MHSLCRVGCALAGFAAVQASAIDMVAMERWSNAKVVSYKVEGKHTTRSSVVNGNYEGNADVFDQVIVEFTWDRTKSQAVGPVTVKDSKTELKNLKSDGTNCPPPTLQGEYEHFQSDSKPIMENEQVRIKGVRVYPAAMVSNYPASCSMRSIPGAKEDVTLYVALVDPGILAMPEMAKSGPISVSADGKSFSVQGAENWVWTYTPKIVQ